MSDPIRVTVRKLPHAAGIDLPEYATSESAGMDLRAAVPEGEPFTLKAGAYAMIPTGLQIALPSGFEAQVRPRSGLAAKHGVTVLNSPGTIDSDYRGECQVILINLGAADFVITRGERIAQLVVARHARVWWDQKESLDSTERGAGGFGSTGK
jgi:dUTP pyrophosphatase